MKPLDYSAVVVLAEAHIVGLPPLPAGFRRVLTEGRRVEGGWYFDSGLEKVPPNEGGPGSGIGGAPGFLVSDDGIVRTIGWPEYTRLCRQNP